jgi:hypothetical protein
MENYPTPYDIELSRFRQARSIALRRITRLGLSCSYICGEYDYEKLFLLEVQLDFNISEKEYLKDCILGIFECLKAVKNEKDLTQEEAEKRVREIWKDKLEENRKLKGFKEHEEKWISEKVRQEIEDDIPSKKTTIFTLEKELAYFKIRLGRMNIFPTITGDKIEFSQAEEKPDIEATEIENPYPKIFVDAEAYLLFINLHAIFNYKDSNTHLADYSFIYRQMHKDKLILDKFKPQQYINWLDETFGITIGNLKPLLPTPLLKMNIYDFAKSKR